MRAKFAEERYALLSDHEAQFYPTTQMLLSSGHEYEVHAVSMFDGVVFLLVVDDTGAPSFVPRSLFLVVDVGIPGDWICNFWDGDGVQLVLGPRFIASSSGAYEAMSDQRYESTEQLRRRIRGMNNDG